jgi:hypothetical protein
MSWEDILKAPLKPRELAEAEEFASEELTDEKRRGAEQTGREYIPKEKIIIEPYSLRGEGTLKYEWSYGGAGFMLKGNYDNLKEWEENWTGWMHDVNGNVEFSDKAYFPIGKYDATLKMDNKTYPVIINVYDKQRFYVE